MTAGATSTRPRAVLFDMGGVLLDMGNAAGLPEGKLDFRGREALAHAIRRAGGHVAEDDLERSLFAPWRKAYERRYEEAREASWAPHCKRLRHESHCRLRDLTLLAAWFEPYAEGLAPRPHALETLTALREAHVRMAVVSNVPLPGALYRRVLERHGLAGFFANFQWSYDAGSRKPSPVLPRQALTALGAVPEEAWMIGDRRSSDVAAARAAGIFSVWLRSHDTGGPRPDLEVSSLEELAGCVLG